jgi:hypothetical protein
MKSRRSPRGAALQAEFAVCLFVFLLVTAFPMLDLLGLAAGFATAAFAATQSAHKASLATTYPEAVSEALDAAYGIAGGCFGTFAGLVPNGGLSNSGVDLYVYVTDINSGTVKVFGPNSAVTDKIDSAANIYEYCARVNYHCGPMINMSSVPFIKDVSGLGKPFELTYSAFRATEYSDGLNGTGNAAPLLGSKGPFTISYTPQTATATTGPATTSTSATGPPSEGSEGAHQDSGGWGPPPTEPPKPGDWWYGRGPWEFQKR